MVLRWRRCALQPSRLPVSRVCTLPPQPPWHASYVLHARLCHHTPHCPHTALQYQAEQNLTEEQLAARVDTLVKAHLLHITNQMLALHTALANSGGPPVCDCWQARHVAGAIVVASWPSLLTACQQAGAFMLLPAPPRTAGISLCTQPGLPHSVVS